METTTPSTLRERLRLYIKTKGMKIRAFETSCGMTSSYVNNIRNGIGREKLANVFRNYPDLNKEWLLTGEGEMLVKPEILAMEDTATELERLCAENTSLQAVIKEKERIIKEKEKLISILLTNYNDNGTRTIETTG